MCFWLPALLQAVDFTSSSIHSSSPPVMSHVEGIFCQLVAVTCAGQTKGIPHETFVAIETLLPTGKGKFLELWAARNVQRAGWTHVVEASLKQKT